MMGGHLPGITLKVQRQQSLCSRSGTHTAGPSLKRRSSPAEQPVEPGLGGARGLLLRPRPRGDLAKGPLLPPADGPERLRQSRTSPPIHLPSVILGIIRPVRPRGLT